MSCRILRYASVIRPDAPTFAQQVEKLVGRQIDAVMNDPERCVAETLYVLGWQTALTVEHLVELFVVRPIVAAVAR
ncbi:hypothetical protein SEA_HURRICANE_50 [Mycobacterium phage Hurricane]|uniref:Uncharacterized protein n=1 Tax=Mycobacterium phage Hurricane TaxID=2015810 RepID=A0A222ZJ92_9CAUD|nr:hypothetical protein I5G83_gp50 [Mycobacterium phage Hurricane]ASR84796.1 hypothetical protein SEA_HURRICANE_50 [Mycobacterium phage Hurricane]